MNIYIYIYIIYSCLLIGGKKEINVIVAIFQQRCKNNLEIPFFLLDSITLTIQL